jgi:hypothetical protein
VQPITEEELPLNDPTNEPDEQDRSSPIDADEWAAGRTDRMERWITAEPGS